MKKHRFDENFCNTYDIFLIFKEHLQTARKEINPG